MQNDIRISVNQKEKNNYKGNMYLGFIAFFSGILSILLFFNGLDAVTYSKEIVYTLAFILSLAVCYTYYNKPKLSLYILGAGVLGAFLVIVTRLEEFRLQSMSLVTAFSNGTAAIKNITVLMCVLTVLLIILFYLFELVLKVHFILLMPIVFFLMVAPFLKISVTVFNVFTIIIYQTLFYVIDNTLIKSKRKSYTYILNSRKNILEKSAVVCMLFAIIAFLLSDIIMNILSESFYGSVSGVEETFYKVSNIVSGKASDINMDGSVSIGNNYQTGAEQLLISANRKPEQDIYLIGYTGGEYAGNNWKRADDTKICNEMDIKYGTSYYTIRSTADTFKILYYTSNVLLKNDGLTISKDKDRRISLDIQYKGDGNNIIFRPYCSSQYSSKNDIADNGYSLMYYEQADMLTSWNSSSTGYQKSKVKDYTNVQNNYKKNMRSYYLQYSEKLNPKLLSYVKDNPLNTLNEKTTFILYTFMSNTRYTRKPGIMLGNSDVADTFLFDSQRGYCVHYATAATLMYRMYGIPARYVTGFKVTPDSFKEDENSNWVASVTDSMQHAWTEIFIDNYGWVPVDVTPVSDGTMNVSYPGYDMHTFNKIMEQHNWIADYPSIHDASNEDVEYVRTRSGAIKAAVKKIFSIIFRIIKIMLVICISVFIILSPLLLRLRRRLVIKRENTKKCSSIYKRMIKMLHCFGYVTDYDGTEVDFADRLNMEFNNMIKNDVKLAVQTSIETEFSTHRIEEKNIKNVYEVYKEISELIYVRLSRWKKFMFTYVYCFGI